jgi:hypothetical protein
MVSPVRASDVADADLEGAAGDLLPLKELIEAGTVTPVIDAEGHARGKVVITV